MIRETLTIINKLGLHARAAMQLVKLSSQYQSETLIHHNEKTVNAKDILDVMMLGAKQGSEIELTIAGEDEQETAEALSKLINNRFGEAE